MLPKILTFLSTYTSPTYIIHLRNYYVDIEKDNMKTCYNFKMKLEDIFFLPFFVTLVSFGCKCISNE